MAKVEIEMFVETCPSCGIAFAMPKSFNDGLRKCHNTFYCPVGHSQSYPSKSPEEKLKQELWEAKQKIQDLQSKEQERLEKQRNRRKGSKEKKS